MKNELRFLGHIINEHGIKVDPDKISVIKQWTKPKDKSQVRSLLGFGNYFRRFIPKYSQMVLPLTELTKKDTPTTWTPECETAFQQLKNAIINAPVLRHPILDKPFTLVCDASNFASGAILLQDGHPIAFSSKSSPKLNATTRQKNVNSLQSFKDLSYSDVTSKVPISP